MSSLRQLTSRFEPWWTFLLAPIIQEFVFRFIPYQFLALRFPQYVWEIGVASAVLFGAIHWYFSIRFAVYAFVWGLILWWVMGAYGYFAVVLIHIILNFVHVALGVITLENDKSS